MIVFDFYSNKTFASLFFIFGFLLGQLIEIVKGYRTIIELDRPEKPPTSIIQKINPSFPSEYSLFLGQLYCRALVPFFFLYLLILVPGWIIVIPHHNDNSLITILFAIMLGIFIRWFYDKSSPFYFSKLTIKNFGFITLKLIILISFIIFFMIKIPSLYLLALISVFTGFVIPWHPEKLR